jgi:hypothetical protein
MLADTPDRVALDRGLHQYGEPGVSESVSHGGEYSIRNGCAAYATVRVAAGNVIACFEPYVAAHLVYQYAKQLLTNICWVQNLPSLAWSPVISKIRLSPSVR